MAGSEIVVQIFPPRKLNNVRFADVPEGPVISAFPSIYLPCSGAARQSSSDSARTGVRTAALAWAAMVFQISSSNEP